MPEPSRPLRDPDDTDAELLRWCHELALQPLDEFRGFEWGEQLHGGTCVRYQLNSLGWALSAYAVNYVPNAPQPMEEVLRNLVLKQTDLRVWGYWRGLKLGRKRPFDVLNTHFVVPTGPLGDRLAARLVAACGGARARSSRPTRTTSRAHGSRCSKSTWPAWAAWWIPVANVNTAARDWNNTVNRVLP